MEFEITEVIVRKRKEQRDNSRIFFFIEGESFEEQMANRKSRPHHEFQKLLPQIFDQINLNNQEANWSQYAGTPLTCSPGFILQEDKGYNIFVTVKEK